MDQMTAQDATSQTPVAAVAEAVVAEMSAPPPPEPKAKDAASGEGLTGPRHFPAVTPDTIRAAFESGKYPYARLMGRATYEAEKAKLQAELLKVQIWAQETGQKFVILMEGRDAAGKGGTIKRFMEHLNPRYARTVALSKPSDAEKGQWFFQRYIQHLPTTGEIVFFDRSWYNRAGVERVMGFTSPDQVQRFLDMVPAVEKAMVDSGILLRKYWLEVDMDEQTRRLKARVDDPRKTWKLSPMDIKSYRHWYDYSIARDEMFAATHTDWAPWRVADSNDKRRARLNILTDLLDSIPYEHLPTKPVRFPRRHPDPGYAEPEPHFQAVPTRW